MSGRILIADSTAGERIVLKARLASHAYQITQAASAPEVLRIVSQDPPDLVLLPRRLGDIDGVALCQAMRADTSLRRLPVILRLDRSDCLTRIRALEAGVDAVVDSTSAPALLSARIRNLLRRYASEEDLNAASETAHGPGFADAGAAFRPAGRVVLITPHAREGVAWRGALLKRLRGQIRVLPESTALAALGRDTQPDAIIVAENAEAPHRTLRLISDLRCRANTMRAPILLVQDSPRTDPAVTALDIGISDLVETGFDADEVAMRLRRELARKAQEDRARAVLRDGVRLAVTDPLTGLFNRRYAMDRLDQFAAEARRGAEGYAVMALDLDRFKSINDRYGHAAGDAVLVEIAARMSRCLRQGDLLARIGGEEFLAVVRGCGLDRAKSAADRLRRAICDRPVTLPDGLGEIPVTVSIGLVMSDTHPAGSGALLTFADRALYEAKADGRNQVTVSSCAA